MILRASIICAALVWGMSRPSRGDVITYIRFEEGSGIDAYDQTGLMDGRLIQFSDTSPGGGDLYGEGWSASVPSPVVPLTGETNTGSLRFGGGSEFVDLSNGHDLSLSNSFTIEFYLKPDQPIIGSPVFGFSPNAALGLTLTESSGDLYFNMTFMDQTPYTEAAGVQTGVWQHIALVKEPSEYSIYLNGTLLANEALPSSADGPYFFPGTDITGDRTIGGNSGTWRGYIDEFRISDEALTPDRFLIAVPEPGTLFLCLIGVAALCMSCLKRRFS